MPNPQYQSYPYIFSTKGLFARYAIDRIPDHGMFNFDNGEVRYENSISSRLGRQVITTNGTDNTPLPDHNIHTLARLKGLAGSTYRYAGAGTNVYRRVGDLPGSYTQINGSFVLSGNRFSAMPYRPSNSAFPFIFFADSNVMTKDDGSFNPLEQWGIFPPTVPAFAELLQFDQINIENFDKPIGNYVATGFTGALVSIPIVNTTISGITNGGGPGRVTITPADMVSIIPNSQVDIGTENDVVVISITATTFDCFVANNHAIGEAITNSMLGGTLAAGATATIERFFTGDLSHYPGGGPVLPTDLINLGINTTATNLTVSLAFSVGDSSFTNSYVQFYPVTGTGVITELTRQQQQFAVTGMAGMPGFTWGNVEDWKITITASSAGGATIYFNDLYLYGGGGPTVQGGGVPYDYRYTYYNINTGNESGPSQIMLNPVSPVNQPIEITWQPSPDPQVTHVRVYRRGGVLPDQWLLVAQVPVGTTTFVDTLTDEQIAENPILNTDTFPPVTSNLAVPVDTMTLQAITGGAVQNILLADITNIFPNQVITLDQLGANPEDVVVQFVIGSTITAYFQLAHNIDATVQASTRIGQPVNLGTIAFDRAWLAGDPNNPNILYYSDRFNPESFPVENTLEVGVPSDPIMAVMEWNGQLYVFTVSTVWNILGAQGGLTPLPYKTAAKHGLNASFAYAITEAEIWYQSVGGIYAFQGSASRYTSEPIEWIFTNQFISDTVQRPVIPMNQTQVTQTVMAYYQNEIYTSYIGTDGSRHRVIYNRIYNRWRNDDVLANTLLVEDDIYTLLFSDTQGMIYQDRVGNYDDGGFAGGVPLFVAFSMILQLAAQDVGMPKNFKTFNELTLDIDTGGTTCDVRLAFDYGGTIIDLGTVTTLARDQVNFVIRGGDGYLSLNVSLILTGTIGSAVADPITIYEAHIRATPEAETRQSYDSYLMDFGSPDYKFVKQGWFEYQAGDPGGITFKVYTGTQQTTPEFTFTLPQSVNRTSVRVRFPPTMARIWRWVATSPGDFRLYSDSRIEWKRVTKDKGYTLQPLQREMAQQP